MNNFINEFLNIVRPLSSFSSKVHVYMLESAYCWYYIHERRAFCWYAIREPLLNKASMHSSCWYVNSWFIEILFDFYTSLAVLYTKNISKPIFRLYYVYILSSEFISKFSDRFLIYFKALLLWIRPAIIAKKVSNAWYLFYESKNKSIVYITEQHYSILNVYIE